jgi:hypothetical protein
MALTATVLPAAYFDMRPWSRGSVLRIFEWKVGQRFQEDLALSLPGLRKSSRNFFVLPLSSIPNISMGFTSQWKFGQQSTTCATSIAIPCSSMVRWVAVPTSFIEHVFCCSTKSGWLESNVRAQQVWILCVYYYNVCLASSSKRGWLRIDFPTSNLGLKTRCSVEDRRS